MSYAAVPLSGRLSDPSITSEIFAPRPQNYMLSSVSTQLRIAESVTPEAILDQDELVTRTIAERLRRLAPDIQTLIAVFLRDYFETSFMTPPIKLPGEIARIEPEGVPARAFPFASHLNLLGPAVEGLSFDLDDFQEG